MCVGVSLLSTQTTESMTYLCVRMQAKQKRKEAWRGYAEVSYDVPLLDNHHRLQAASAHSHSQAQINLN